MQRYTIEAILAVATAAFVGGCAHEDVTGPPAPESAPTPISIRAAVTTSYGSGIPFGAWGVKKADLAYTANTYLFDGAQFSGALPKNIVRYLKEARKHGYRVTVRLAGARSRSQNADGTFSLRKWKKQVNRFKGINLNQFINDGTLIGHMMLDDVTYKHWGGRRPTFKEIEGMAKHSESIWPKLATLVRTDANRLRRIASGSNYKHLDGAWNVYRSSRGNVAKFASKQTNAANQLGLKYVNGLNILGGGDGSSGIKSPVSSTKWAMSANEIRTYGRTLLKENPCAFLVWKYIASHSYFKRSDIKNALKNLEKKADNRPAKSCR